MFRSKSNAQLAAQFVAVSEERVSAKEFLDIKSRQPSEIKNVKFVAPKIGSKDFGTFTVEYRTPKLIPAG